MKTKFLLLILFSLSTANCFTQTFAGYGFKGGVVSAYQSVTSSRFGISAGLFGEFIKLKSFSTILEINFVQKGGNEKLLNPIKNNYSTLNLLSIPLLAKFSFQTGLLHPYIALGPRMDILLSKNDGYYQGWYSYINPINFGISFMAGSEIGISKKISLLAEVSYSPDISTYIIPSISERISIRNFAFEFRTGLKFNL